MRFSSLAVAAFAAAVQASHDVYVYTTCYSTRTVERVVATSYVTAPTANGTYPSIQPTAYSSIQPTAYPAGNSTVPVVQPQPSSPGVTNGASTLGVQAAGLAAAVGIIGVFLA